MADCCSPDCGRFFNRRVAEHDARRYRTRGLTGTAGELARLAGDVTGASILEVGGGIGTIELELLAAGAERATNVELSPAYEDVARELVAERGFADRVERRVADFAAEPAAAEPHDIVVMHRVVCCYPDADALVGAAAERTRRRLVLTYPQERLLIRAGVRVVNAFLRLRGGDFRVFVHRRTLIAAAAQRAGLVHERTIRHGFCWESAAFENPAAR